MRSFNSSNLLASRCEHGDGPFVSVPLFTLCSFEEGTETKGPSPIPKAQMRML